MPDEKDERPAEEFHAMEPGLAEQRHRARELCRALNATRDEELELRRELLAQLFGSIAPGGWGVWLEPPFHCDYGSNIHLGAGVFFNFNCVVLDAGRVTIGNDVLFGPNVQIYTVAHPMGAAARRTGLQYRRPVTIGSDVWVGGGAIICPGVTIGSRTVIGAGSVVTRDIPDDVFAAGNPCRVIRAIEEGCQRTSITDLTDIAD